MTVHTCDPIRDPRWAELVQRHQASSIFHSVAWSEALARTYAYEPVVYTTSSPAVPLTNGIILCRVRSWLTGHRMVSLPFADHCDPLVDDTEDRSKLLAALAREKTWRYVELRPQRFEISEPTEFEQSRSFHLHVLDLRFTLDELFDRFHPSAIQRKIRRAEREGLIYEEGQSEALLQAFYSLTILTRRRQGLPPPPLSWFKNLISSIGNRAMIRVAFNDRRPVGSIFTLQHGATLVYKYGCSDARFHSLGAMPFLFWKAIQYAKAAGLEAFDLGRSDSDNQGLITFKERLGATPSTITYLRSSKRERSGGRTLHLPRRLIARVPDRLLVTAGNLLYRHFA